jgi:hypothetical protein
MALINRSEVNEVLKSSTLIQSAGGVPNILAGQIVPVMEVNPRLTRQSGYIRSATQTTTGSFNIFASASATQETYITGALLTMSKDATCDIADGFITMTLTPYGDSGKNIIQIPILTLTAQSIAIPLILSNPIRIQPGSAISISGTFTVGKLLRVGIVYGYQCELGAL